MPTDPAAKRAQTAARQARQRERRAAQMERWHDALRQIIAARTIRDARRIAAKALEKKEAT